MPCTNNPDARRFGASAAESISITRKTRRSRSRANWSSMRTMIRNAANGRNGPECRIASSCFGRTNWNRNTRRPIWDPRTTSGCLGTKSAATSEPSPCCPCLRGFKAMWRWATSRSASCRANRRREPRCVGPATLQHWGAKESPVRRTVRRGFPRFRKAARGLGDMRRRAKPRRCGPRPSGCRWRRPSV